MRALVPFTLGALAALALPAHAQSNLRGWHDSGQTWLVWNHNQVFPAGETYEVYRAPSLITDLANAELVGRIFLRDGRGARLDFLDPDLTWTVPDGAGGSYVLAANELLFVYTPHAPASEFFAVVRRGNTGVFPTNRVGPIVQTLDPVQCHRVFAGTDAGRAFTAYAHWVDGRDDLEGGRPDYPVMGSAAFNGTGHLFAAFEPSGGLGPGPIPAVFALHGGTGNFMNWRPSLEPLYQMDFDVPNGLFVPVDDAVQVFKQVGQQGAVVDENTRWFGYWEDFDRYDGARPLPPNDALVIDYTLRRLDFIREWLIAERDVDPARVAMTGGSMGGGGTSFYARRNPGALSAGHVLVSSFVGGGNPFNPFMQGSVEQNLATNLPGGIGLGDYYCPTNTLSDDDLPFLRFTYGINDTVTGWIGRVPVFEEIEALRWGAHIYWDEREHGPSGGGWLGAHWSGSPRLGPADLARYRADQSFPAITAGDHDSAPGRQPDPGDDVEPANGDPFGTWGGYFDWDQGSIVDEADRWSMTVFLVSDSPFASDLPPNPTATCDLSIRRAQHFRPAPGLAYCWWLQRVGDGAFLDGGVGFTPAVGPVTLRGLTLSQEPARIRVRLGCRRARLGPITPRSPEVVPGSAP